MPTLRKVVVLLLLAALLAAPWASAAGQQIGKSRAVKGDSPVGTLLSRVQTFLNNVWSKIGCGIDPSGRCIIDPAPTEDPQPQSDIGCGIDPDGYCHS